MDSFNFDPNMTADNNDVSGQATQDHNYLTSDDDILYGGNGSDTLNWPLHIDVSADGTSSSTDTIMDSLMQDPLTADDFIF